MDQEQKKHPKVLIVEDDPGHQRLLEIYIKRLGCECDCCYDGRSGLDKAVADDYDLIFVDIHIPELDGFMVAIQLREHSIQTPMVAITALKLEGIERKALAVGYNDFLAKPIEPESLAVLVQKYTFSDSVRGVDNN